VEDLKKYIAQKEAEKQRIEAERLRAEQARISKLLNKKTSYPLPRRPYAEAAFRDSQIEGLINEFTDLVKCGAYGIAHDSSDRADLELRKPRRRFDPDSKLVLVYWDEVTQLIEADHMYETRSTAGKSFIVEAHPSDKIKFHRGWFGSVSIKRKDWEIKGKGAFEKVFVEMYKHPHTYWFKNITQAPYTGSGW
jgi:hypothetical protein